MKKSNYVGNNELEELIKLYRLAIECDKISTTTKDANWNKWLKYTSSTIKRMFNERISYVDAVQIPSLERRLNSSNIVLVSKDLRRIEKENGEPVEEITIDKEDLYDALDMACLTCKKCRQGNLVKTCRFRKVLHRLAVPVLRDSTKPGECEYKEDNTIACVGPEYTIVKEG